MKFIIKLYQFCVMVAFVSSNGMYNWSENKLVPAVVSLGFLYYTTPLLYKLLSLLGLKESPLQRLDQQ